MQSPHNNGDELKPKAISPTMFQLPAVPPFSLARDPATAGQRWERWVTSLECYIMASNVTDPARKRAILLHLAGPEVQALFETFPEQ